MANTTNFGWETPDDTDLVKDGAAAMRTLGNSIDTSFVDLKGGTTGQILSKASNTDLDYTWINNDQGDITEVVAGTGISGGGTSGSVTVTNSMATAIDAKGDLIAGTGADAFARLGVGTNGQVLTANSANATGLGWSTIATGSLTQIASVTFNNTSATWDVSSIPSTYTHLMILGYGLQTAQTSVYDVILQLNNDTGANYNTFGWRLSAGTASLNNNIGGTSMIIGPSTGFTADATSRFGSFMCVIPNYASSYYKTAEMSSGCAAGGSGYNQFNRAFWNNTSAINRITVTQNGPGAAFKAGNAILYGVN